MAQVVIIGAGPGGLGVGWRLAEQGFDDFLILERDSYPGGLAASFKTSEDFYFDIGGHVFFSRNDYFNQVAKTLLEHDRHIHYSIRNAFVYLQERVVPYPFQDNIAALNPQTQFEIVRDLVAPPDKKSKKRPQPRDFLSWLRKHFRGTLSHIFMEPYNRKVWAYDPKKMGAYWIKDRVSTLDVERILKRVILKEQSHDWGPNARFFFPQYGSGHLFSRVAETFKDKIAYNSEVTHIDSENQRLFLQSGREIPFTHLVSSMPLNELVNRSVSPYDGRSGTACINAASRLRYNSGVIYGFGIDFDIRSEKHWIYFPEPGYPWFRMTVLSNYSPAMAPRGKSSLMFDISYNPYKGIKIKATDIIPLLKTIAFLPPISAKNIASIFERRVKYFYPIPTLDRDRDLAIINRYLERSNIYTIGRFGRWRYEEGNMDHAFLQGKSTADEILSIVE